MIGGLLGEILFQAFLFFIILRLIARHEADYDFGKLAMLSAVITMCTTVLTLVAADKGLIYIPLGYLAAVVVSVWLLVQFCWVPVWKALIAVMIVIPVKAGVRILALILLGRAIGGPQVADSSNITNSMPAQFLAEVASVISAEEGRLREIHGWLRWQVPLNEQISAAKQICDSRTPPVQITGITALVVKGADGDVPLRSGRMKITGRAGGQGPETAAAVLKTLSEHGTTRAAGVTVFAERMIPDPVDTRFTIFTLEAVYPPRFLLPDVPAELEPDPIAAAALILPAEDAFSAVSNQIAATAGAAGLEITRLQELPMTAAGGRIGLCTVTVAGRGPWDSLIKTLSGLEQNRGLQIEKLSIRPLTNGRDWEAGMRIEQAMWTADRQMTPSTGTLP